MTEEYRLSDTDVISMVEKMTDAERIELIVKLGNIGTEQAQRHARFLMELHLAERFKADTLH